MPEANSEDQEVEGRAPRSGAPSGRYPVKLEEPPDLPFQSIQLLSVYVHRISWI
jgi:hypothetical protein